MLRYLKYATLAALFYAAFAWLYSPLRPGFLFLPLVERKMAREYPAPQVTTDSLAAGLAARPEEWLLFDTRDPDEFAVSHITRARRVDFELDPESFLAAWCDSLRGRHVVFYCSIGGRSSIFLRKVEAHLAGCGALSADNLRGGLFRWYNQGRPVVDSRGPTDRIHPFSRRWGWLVRPRGNACLTTRPRGQ